MQDLLTYLPDPTAAKFNVIILSFLYPMSMVELSPGPPKTYYPQTVANASTFTLAYENGYAGVPLPAYSYTSTLLAWLMKYQSIKKNGVQNKVLFSVGGAAYSGGSYPNPYPLWAGNESAVAQGIVTFIEGFQKANQSFLFDGIDIDFEDTAALMGNSTYNAQSMLTALTQQLRQKMNTFNRGSPVNNNQFNFISHAPQVGYMSYLGSYAVAVYYPVITAAGDDIDLYNIQFYNNPQWTGSGPLSKSPVVPFPIANTLWGLITGQTSSAASGSQTVPPVPISKLAIGIQYGVPIGTPMGSAQVLPSNIVDLFGGDSVAPHRQFSLMFWTQGASPISTYVNDLVTAFYA
jgi:chitinase